ncbi:MAG: glycosyltransferase family 2 protein [Rhizobiaceae bacterium]|nr:glycosyltransferase family 2 protein [Rhizobiaceae bacterium]
MAIISLSTIPSRFDKIGPTLESLLKQTADIDEIRLYIPKSYLRFPDYDGTALPDIPDGVTLYRPAQDDGPASKVINCLVDPDLDPNTHIIFCDDDRIYDPDWVQKRLNQSAEHPDCAITGSGLIIEGYIAQKREFTAAQLPRAERFPKYMDVPYKLARMVRIAINDGIKKAFTTKFAKPTFRKSGYIDIFEGFSGVLVKPRFFTKDVTNIPEIAQFQDDIWLSANVAHNGFQIWTDAGKFRPKFSEADELKPLNLQIFEGSNRRELNRKIIQYCQEHMGIWR